MAVNKIAAKPTGGGGGALLPLLLVATRHPPFIVPNFVPILAFLVVFSIAKTVND